MIDIIKEKAELENVPLILSTALNNVYLQPKIFFLVLG
jgi:hypothetical protein